ncbi:zf-HC2 domain-containing protein [Streptomyces netropsis]|uniref:Anti-sigma factor RsiW n=1 Tax=Streptomyces netropsis TaxID=55404 RepID=A0A7W7PET8_STRNE|nr:zf-HC2 domain-containing protein [Streptomyces netropsis]MBB4885980.1 anti-sigma factor RsiW [Streptomyces netropsis]GGR17436.1 hypothetical protein GCM10010219_23110 [Streptomyces netropsis]
MTGSGGQSPAEHHLGDRLAALVDGELGHDSRERVLAHLATCWTCKAEADAQRRLKNVFAQAAPPPLSDSLLARLQGLPATGGDDGQDGRQGPGGPGKGAFGVRAEDLALLPGVDHRPFERGFRTHDVERGSARGRRFAFAAAGAVSLAAFALGGSQPPETAVDTPRARAENARRVASPLAMAPGRVREDTRRERGMAAASQDRPTAIGAPVVPTSLSAALLRPSGAPLLPPLIRTTLAVPTAPPPPPAGGASSSH